MSNALHCWTEKLSDGASVQIRPITKEDAALDRDFIEHLSSTSRWFRFLNEINHPSAELLKQLTDVDQINHIALIATVVEDKKVKAIGVARYAVDNDGEDCAECAVAVADNSQHQGLGGFLLSQLIDIARDNGIKRLYAIDSAENFKAHDLAKKFNFESKLDATDRTRMIHSKNIVRTEFDGHGLQVR